MVDETIIFAQLSSENNGIGFIRKRAEIAKEIPGLTVWRYFYVKGES